METLSTTLKNTYKLTEKPQYDRRRCWGYNGMAIDCTACVDLCPEKLFTPGRRDKKPDFTKCTRCGICTAVCPGGALTPIDVFARYFLNAVGRDSEVSIGCDRDDDTGWTVSVPCLASIGWAEIAIAALRNGITLSLRECGSCPKEDCAAAIMKTLTRVKTFLGDDLFFDKVNILEKGDSYEGHGKEISRRELFTFFKRLPTEGARELLPDLAGQPSALLYRAILRDLVKKRYDETPKEERSRYVVTLPVISGDCNACGMCRNICPSKALDFKRGPDRKATGIVVDAWKCTGCGICQKMCSRKAIEGMGDMSVAHLGTVLLKRLT